MGIVVKYLERSDSRQREKLVAALFILYLFGCNRTFSCCETLLLWPWRLEG